MNWEAVERGATEWSCVNTAVEATSLNDRAFCHLLPQVRLHYQGTSLPIMCSLCCYRIEIGVLVHMPRQKTVLAKRSLWLFPRNVFFFASEGSLWNFYLFASYQLASYHSSNVGCVYWIDLLCAWAQGCGDSIGYMCTCIYLYAVVMIISVILLDHCSITQSAPIGPWKHGCRMPLFEITSRRRTCW